MGLIGRHWRGDLTPLVSALGVLVGGRILLACGWRFVPVHLPGWALGGLVLADGLVLVWQCVGAWRSLSRGLDPGGDRMLKLALQLVVMGSVPLAVNLWLNHWAAAAAPLPEVAAPVLPLPVEDGAAVIEGFLDYDILQRFDATPEGFGAVRLNSPGGLVYAARALALRVAERHLATEVEGDCLSACTLVFLAAERRVLGPAGRLGFHEYIVLNDAPLFNLPAEQARDHAYLLARGVSAEFVAHVERTPHDKIWIPTREELVAGGVLAR